MTHYIEHDPSTGSWHEIDPLKRADLVAVVRCRDCRFASEVTWPIQYQVPPDYLDCHGELVETWDYYNDEPKDNPVPPDGFCAWGERREGV